MKEGLKEFGGLLLPDSPEFHRRPAGHCIIDGREVACTLKCEHCGRQWIPVKGSGVRRGFCMKCNGVTCGQDACLECYPFEKRMEDYEKGRLPVL